MHGEPVRLHRGLGAVRVAGGDAGAGVGLPGRVAAIAGADAARRPRSCFLVAARRHPDLRPGRVDLVGLAAQRAATPPSRGSRPCAPGTAPRRRCCSATRPTRWATPTTCSARWWTAPARLVPFVAQQAEALATLTGQGQAIAAVRRDGGVQGRLPRSCATRRARSTSAELRALQDPLGDVADDAGPRPGPRSTPSTSPWLVGPVATRAEPGVRRGRPHRAPGRPGGPGRRQVAPGLLGGDGTRHYFVAFTTPAEERGPRRLHGQLGRAHRHRRQADAQPLGAHAGAGRLAQLAGGRGAHHHRAGRLPGALRRRSSRRTYFQDVTMSPDLPSVADVIGQLYPQMGGDHIDGVLVVDPYGLAALLNFTGPIDIEGSLGDADRRQRRRPAGAAPVRRLPRQGRPRRLPRPGVEEDVREADRPATSPARRSWPRCSARRSSVAT